MDDWNCALNGPRNLSPYNDTNGDLDDDAYLDVLVSLTGTCIQLWSLRLKMLRLQADRYVET